MKYVPEIPPKSTALPGDTFSVVVTTDDSSGNFVQHIVARNVPLEPGRTYTYSYRFSTFTGETASPGIPFSLTDRTGTVTASQGTSGAVTTGTGRLQPNPGSSTPAGLAIYGYRVNSVLVTEAAVPASKALTSGRVYAEIAPPVNTGIAFVNPNHSTATLTFSFVNEAGTAFRSGVTTIGPNTQLVGFLDGPPFNGGTDVRGTFTFSADIPVAAIALRSFMNERGEPLYTTLPVIDLSTPPGAGPQYLSDFADGGGWTTQIVLVNPTDVNVNGTVQFFSQGTSAPASPVTLNVNGQTSNTFGYSIAARSVTRLRTAGTSPPIAVGSVRVVPTSGSAAPVPLVVFSYKPSGITTTEVGVPAVTPGTRFRIYAEASGVMGSPGATHTALAVANTANTATTITVELARLDGSSIGLTGSFTLPANGQTAVFLTDIPGLRNLPTPFKGVARLTSTTPIAVVGLRSKWNERTEFLVATTPPVNEAAPPSAAPTFFPQIADGGGYSTEFILFSGQGGQASTGTLALSTRNGESWNLALGSGTPLPPTQGGPPPTPSSSTITTIAGSVDGSVGQSGDGGPATAALLWFPFGVVADANGNLFIADYRNNRVRKVTASGTISTVAGSEAQGFSGDGGPATAALLRGPTAVAVDTAGNLLFADGHNNRVRKVTSAGVISTIVGTGPSTAEDGCDFGGDGGIATSARLCYTWGLAVDTAGNVFVSDRDNRRVRKIAPNGIITTFAGTGTAGFSGDNGPATQAQLSRPTGLAADAAGNLFVADDSNHRVRKISPNGTITTVAGNGVRGYTGDGGPAASAQLNQPTGVAVDRTGNLYIADYGNNVIRKVDTAGVISTIAGTGVSGYSGDGGAPAAAQLAGPYGLAIDAAGNLLITEFSSRIRKITFR